MLTSKRTECKRRTIYPYQILKEYSTIITASRHEVCEGHFRITVRCLDGSESDNEPWLCCCLLFVVRDRHAVFLTVIDTDDPAWSSDRSSTLDFVLYHCHQRVATLSRVPSCWQSFSGVIIPTIRSSSLARPRRNAESTTLSKSIVFNNAVWMLFGWLWKQNHRSVERQRELNPLKRSNRMNSVANSGKKVCNSTKSKCHS